MNYTVKFVVIISIVAVVSFFTASIVIPEKNAVAPNRKKSAARALVSPMPVGGGEIPIVVVDGKPAEKPIMVSGTELAPIDLKALAPAPALEADEPVDASTQPAVVDTKPPVTVVAPVDTKVPPVAATVTTPAVAPPATFSATDEIVTEPAPFVGRTAMLYDVKSVPPNTMAARLSQGVASPPVAPTPAVAPAAPVVSAVTPPVAVAAAVATPPDTVKKRRPDANAPLGYRLAATAVCAAVENRAPKNVADKFPKEAGAVYYFTHAVGAVDSAAVMHRWYHEGKLIQTSILEIKSPNWRTHSKRNFSTMDDPTGNWRVDAVDRRTGKVIESAAFVIE